MRNELCHKCMVLWWCSCGRRRSRWRRGWRRCCCGYTGWPSCPSPSGSLSSWRASRSASPAERTTNKHGPRLNCSAGQGRARSIGLELSHSRARGAIGSYLRTTPRQAVRHPSVLGSGLPSRDPGQLTPEPTLASRGTAAITAVTAAGRNAARQFPLRSRSQPRWYCKSPLVSKSESAVSHPCAAEHAGSDHRRLTARAPCSFVRYNVRLPWLVTSLNAFATGRSCCILSADRPSTGAVQFV